MQCQARSCLVLATLFCLVAPPISSRAEESVETGSGAVATQPEAPNRPDLTPEQQALLAIQIEGERQVAALVESIQEGSRAADFLEVQARIVQIKTETYARLLTTIAEFARARGDEPAALEAERILQQVLHPQSPADAGTPQPRDKQSQKEGGRP